MLYIGKDIHWLDQFYKSKNTYLRKQRADLESIYKEITKTSSFENLLKEHLAERLHFLTHNGNINNKKNRDKDSFQINENLVDESIFDLLPSTQIFPPTFPDTPLKCAAYKADSIPNLNPTPETPKPDKKDDPATNFSHSEHFIDQMYEKMQIEKIKRDLIKDLKCEIKELIRREKENLEIEAGSELETKYTALLVEVERLRNELDKRDQRINNLIDSIEDISIHHNKNLSGKSPLYSFESNNTSPANTPSNNYDNNIITTRRKTESLTATSFASLQSEIHYYREENRDKTLIIKQLIENDTIACNCNNFKYDVLNNKENEESGNYLVQSLKSKSNKNLTLLKKIDDKNTKSDSMETEEKHMNDMNKSRCNNNIDKYCDIKDDQKKDDQRKDNKKRM